MDISCNHCPLGSEYVDCACCDACPTIEEAVLAWADILEHYARFKERYPDGRKKTKP